MRPHHPHARTVTLVRLLTLLGPIKRRGARKRLPQQQQPDKIRDAYFAALLPHIHRVQATFHRVSPEVIRLLIDLRAEQARTAPRADSADDLKRKALKLVGGAKALAQDALDTDAVSEVALKFGRQASTFQRAQLDRQVQAAVGVPFSALEKPIKDSLEGFAALNVDLISTVPDRYFDRIRQQVEDAFESGEEPSTLADRLIEIDDMSENDAERIANDQIGRLSAQLNQERQQSLGVEKYVWRTLADERVCEDCAELDGQTFDWDDPPGDGPPGEHHVSDRCFAEPDFSQILGDLDDNNDEE